ncbi:MAG: hypothetical protein JXR25_13560 [Pontiellaceae bacterium]|nr:hypothetical protein [Pontiellaceae bacterium]MBN2785843.1 hypothetical protein [Pontiellaceae bacterium]
MLKRVVFLLPVFSVAGSAFGTVLFSEHFSDSAISAPPALIYGDESLDYKYHAESGGRIVLNDNNKGLCFKLPDLDLNNHSTLYLSVLMRSLDAPSKEKFAGLFLYNKDEELLGVGNASDSEFYTFWGTDGRGIVIGDVRRPIDQEIHKIVIRIEMNPDGPEKISVGLDPFCRRSEARQPDHMWTTYSSELMFDEIRIRCGNNNCNWEFDELILADSWEDIAKSDANPGEYITGMTQNAEVSENGCLIEDRIARFLPNGVRDADLAPSVALIRAYRQNGRSLPRGFGTVDGKPMVTRATEYTLHGTGEEIRSLPDNWELTPKYGVADGKRFAYFDLPPEYDLYGTGEVTGSLLRNGYKILLQNKDNAYWADHHLYQSHPWVMGIRPDGTAFGILFDSTWIAELDLRNGVVFSVDEDASDFAVIVIEASNPQRIAYELSKLTGFMPMPPRWALGYQQCRHSYIPDTRAKEIADNFRTRQIPCDVIWFDIYYMDGFRVFSFSPEQYPDPSEMNDYLHRQGFKSVWMIDPGVKNEQGYSVYDSGSKIDAWVKTADGQNYTGRVWPGDCVFPDFTSPQVRSWWAGLYKDFMATGIDGVWNDMNEPAIFGAPHSTMPWDNRHQGGGILPEGSHRQYHNIYGMMMVKGSREGIQAANPDKRPFVLTRSNYLGGQRYAATWTGDNYGTWEHMKMSVPMVITLGLSGQPFSGPDIGGFCNDASPELFGHWIALGAFYPFSRAHASDGTANQEPWEFGPEIEQVSRVALERRYQLMPYLYSTFHLASSFGLPIMRPLFYADPSDASLRMEDQAFLVGDALMVIPKWAKDVKRPKGIWIPFSLENQTDQYQCDMLLRGGSILPIGPIVQSTVQIPEEQQITLLIALNEKGEARGSLYEDAGDGYADYRTFLFTAETLDGKVIVKCIHQTGKWSTDHRFVNIKLLTGDQTFYGFGDICSEQGVAIHLK